MLNYIRAYAQVIGLAPEEAVLRYEEVDKTAKPEPPPAALERAAAQAAPGWGCALLVLPWCWRVLRAAR